MQEFFYLKRINAKNTTSCMPNIVAYWLGEASLYLTKSETTCSKWKLVKGHLKNFIENIKQPKPKNAKVLPLPLDPIHECLFYLLVKISL